VLVSHGDVAQQIDSYCGGGGRPLPGTARARMHVGMAAGHLYRTALNSDVDLSPEALVDCLGAPFGMALLALLDACHTMLDC
jgi:hypothetical protein